MTRRWPDAAAHLEPGWTDGLDDSPEAAGSALARVLDHLGEACPTCAETLAPYPGPAVAARASAPATGSSPVPGRFREATERAVARVEALLREREDAPPRLDELEAAPLSRALGLLASSPRFRTWGVAALLLDKATAALRGEDGEGADRMATLAGLVAGRLEPARYGAGLIEDTLATVCTLRAEALLLRGSLVAAKRKLDRAEAHWERGTAPWFHGARIELARCRLLRALGRPAAAARHLGALADRAGEHGEIELFLDAVALLVRVSADLGEPEGALRAVQILETGWTAAGRRSSRERTAVAVEVARAHCTAGLFDEALQELHAARPDLTALADPTLSGRAAWWTGVALRGLGRRAEAEAALTRAWTALEAAGRGLEAARAALDLLLLHAETGRPHPFQTALDRLSDLLATEGLPRPAAATLLRFQAHARRTGPDPRLTALARTELEGPWPEDDTPGVAN